MELTTSTKGFTFFSVGLVLALGLGMSGCTSYNEAMQPLTAQYAQEGCRQKNTAVCSRLRMQMQRVYDDHHQQGGAAGTQTGYVYIMN